MITRVCLIALFLGVTSGVLLGSDRCTWGPAYWCESVENVKECGKSTLDHCRNKVWVGDHPLAGMTDPIFEDEENKVEGSSCTICELIGEQIFEKLKNNATEEEILVELESVCGYFPNPDTCKNYVEVYGKMFLDAFVNDVDVKEVCTVMGLCSEEFQSIMRQATLMSALLSKNVGDIGCDTCISLAGLVQKEVLANEKEIETMLDQVCSVVPVDQNECDSFVNSAFETAISLFESYKAKELCQMAGLCQAGADDAGSLLGVGPVDISGSTNLLGKDDDCENGPSFWCSSEENAKKCNMVDFCKKAGVETTVF